jgi:hypothetical protein
MKSPLKILVIVSILLFPGCNSENSGKPGKLRQVNIAEAFETRKFKNLSTIVDGSIDYVCLETTEKSLLGGFPRVYVTDSIVATISFRKILLFKRKTGGFIREIGHFGNDPEGYRATTFTLPFDEENNVFYAIGWPLKQYLCYDQSGRLIKKINAPKETASFAQIDRKINVAFIKNYEGNESRKLVLFSDVDSMVKMYPNYNRFIQQSGISVYRNHGWFYRFDSKLCFFEQFTDTIFQVKPDKLIPLFKLETGKYLPPYKSQQTNGFLMKERKNYFFPENIFESERFLFFQIGYQDSFFQGVYDKKTGETGITKNEDGFENDVNNFIPFHYFSVNTEGKLIGFMEAYKVKQWFAENPVKAAKLPAHLQKLRDIKETDNPVVMIAKLKNQN